MSKTAANILLKAAATVEQGWTQGTWARDQHEKSTSIVSESACKFCIAGAIVKASCNSGGYNSRLCNYVLEAILLSQKDQSRMVRSIPVWNDRKERTQEEVVNVLHTAAMLALADER